MERHVLDQQLTEVHHGLVALFGVVRADLGAAYPGLDVVWPTELSCGPTAIYRHYLSACFDRRSQRYEDFLMMLTIDRRAGELFSRFEMERGDGKSFGELTDLSVPGEEFDSEGAEAVIDYIGRGMQLYLDRRSAILAALAVPFDREE